MKRQLACFVLSLFITFSANAAEGKRFSEKIRIVAYYGQGNFWIDKTQIGNTLDFSNYYSVEGFQGYFTNLFFGVSGMFVITPNLVAKGYFALTGTYRGFNYYGASVSYFTGSRVGVSLAYSSQQIAFTNFHQYYLEKLPNFETYMVNDDGRVNTKENFISLGPVFRYESDRSYLWVELNAALFKTNNFATKVKLKEIGTSFRRVEAFDAKGSLSLMFNPMFEAGYVIINEDNFKIVPWIKISGIIGNRSIDYTNTTYNWTHSNSTQRIVTGVKHFSVGVVTHIGFSLKW